MSSPFAFLRSATNKADKAAKKYAQMQEQLGQMSYKDAYEQMFDQECRSALREIRLMKRMKEVIQDEFAELLELPSSTKTKQEYCITIRPHPDAPITFLDFKYMIQNHVVTRKCFIEGNYSFEQKGTDPEDLGKGFHVHIGAKMTQNSKGQVARDLKNTFKEWFEKGYMNDAGIDVFTRKDAIAWFNTYCLEYQSDDNHKEVTRCWDELWRTGNGLQRFYTITHS